MTHSMTVYTPEGRRHDLEAEPGLTLSAWLESRQLPLNTRCGGRKLCRGCLVEADGRTIRACQHSCGEFKVVRIPEASRRDHRINGVSSFEIGYEHYALRPREATGLALDIGTTTIAAALWDLKNGNCLAAGSLANEQRRFGDNLLSRIDYAQAQGGSGGELQAALVKDSVLPLLDSLCRQAGLPLAAITEAIAAGNTVMQHSLAGADLSGFSAYPFNPAFLEAQQLNAQTIGFPHSLPLKLAANIGAFVGADIAVGALASGMLEAKGPALLVDFGTNGEILLKVGADYLATATAAGPAFEGGRLNCGAAAGAGVISSLDRSNEQWQPRFHEAKKTIRSTGISGAAYIDFIYHARKAGLLHAMGRFNQDATAVETRQIDDEPQRCVRVHQNQFVSETDIAELIQAKAAIAAGIVTLLNEAGLQADELEALYIAGGFGFHLNCAHAMAIGMLPTLPKDRIRVIGNASLGGASLLLQSEWPDAMDQLLENSRVVELNQLDPFEDNYIDCMPLEELS
jgi:uncharacterized 2Fe-2S/4Fe-4S cluster protein (DUF4445 family)